LFYVLHTANRTIAADMIVPSCTLYHLTDLTDYYESDRVTGRVIISFNFELTQFFLSRTIEIFFNMDYVN